MTTSQDTTSDAAAEIERLRAEIRRLKAEMADRDEVADAVAREANALERALLRVQAACGMPDPAEACRTILVIVESTRAALSRGAV